MKVGERGQVTIPKPLRTRHGLGPKTEVEFCEVGASLVLRKKPQQLNLKRWKGRCRRNLAALGYQSVDAFVEDLRGR
jgi:AbrB family looped-hinge helix DNA binding protein